MLVTIQLLQWASLHALQTASVPKFASDQKHFQLAYDFVQVPVCTLTIYTLMVSQESLLDILALEPCSRLLTSNMTLDM